MNSPAATKAPHSQSEFWDALAPYHSAIENTNLDLPSIRRILHEIRQPVLVVGAGQGLIVEELQKNGLRCDGVDLNLEMIRFAKVRLGLDIIHADARALPFENGAYETVIYATGVVDFIGDEEQISAILKEGRRVTTPSGNLFVAFYKASAGFETFLQRVGLLKDNVLLYRESLEMQLLPPHRTIALVARRAGVSYLRAATLLLGAWAGSTIQEKRVSFRMQKIVRKIARAKSIISWAPETLPYRNEAEIRNLFKRLAIPVRQFGSFGNCSIVKI